MNVKLLKTKVFKRKKGIEFQFPYQCRLLITWKFEHFHYPGPHQTYAGGPEFKMSEDRYVFCPEFIFDLPVF